LVVTYTTAALVKKRVENLDSSLVTADIEQFINEAEGRLNVLMKTSFISTFDATKHAILRSVASDMAAFSCVTYNPEEIPSIEAADMTANMLWNSIESQLEILRDPGAVRYLSSL